MDDNVPIIGAGKNEERSPGGMQIKIGYDKARALVFISLGETKAYLPVVAAMQLGHQMVGLCIQAVLEPPMPTEPDDNIPDKLPENF